MSITKSEIQTIVEQVVGSMGRETKKVPDSPPEDTGQMGVFSDMEKAIEAAEKAHYELTCMTLEKRNEIIENIRRAVLGKLENLSKVAEQETAIGKWKDKVKKNELVARKTPGVEDLEPYTYTDDYGLTLIERAPYGVIGSITPSTNPTETLICNGIGMIAGGNSVVFNPHPAAKRTSHYTIALMNSAIIEAGGPANLLCTIAEPTIESAQALMKHERIRLLVVTGGPAVVKVAMNSGKKVIAAGPGNPPCVVDETADILKAAKDIVNGSGLDNNIICTCEKEVLAVNSIADSLKEEMRVNGAFELNKSQIEEVTRLVIADPGRPGHEGAPNKEFVGKDASVIADAIGLTISQDTKILICDVEKEHPLVWTEQLMPVIPIVRMTNADEAIDLAVMCEHGFKHTASIHSKNIDKLSKMAKVMNCSIFVKNGPNYSGLGFGGAGYTSFTIASPTGEGLTRTRNFTRERRCALIGHFRIV
ncbi:MAG: aldehyde dehydrogenase EutE [Spirochaetota bacterium]|nr:MAG: aldehyde dehydrogenase EutE [Spirochaetota bacterium]